MRRIVGGEAWKGAPANECVQTAYKAQRNRVAAGVGLPWPFQHTLPNVGRAVEDTRESFADAPGER
jgi:hypothetical protein